MNYISTRDKSVQVSSACAIKQGLSKEGGLFVPETIPAFSHDELKQMVNMSYQQRAKKVLSLFLADFSENEIKDCIDKAYNADRFGSDEIAPLYKLDDLQYVLELWHGPTCAFKDMALQILPHLLTYSMQKTGEDNTVVILVATSGDTGKAALEGFCDVAGTKIIVFYPDDGVSEIQKLQMTTQRGNNVCVAAVKGNFDDAQAGVKEIFTNKDYARELLQGKYILSSANSINWGRLVPQIVYYVSAYCDLLKNKEITFGEKINICVPTGNFGNILAAYYAMNMGIPVNKLICASNANNVLTEFIKTGVYDRNRDFYTTISPSMDILISSNLERLLFVLSGYDDQKVREYMDSLRINGKYTVDKEIKKSLQSIFVAGYCSDDQTKQEIKFIKDTFNYTCDTHTAVAMKVYRDYVLATRDDTKTVIASTASPFKFSQSVISAVLGKEAVSFKNEFDLLNECARISGLSIPKSLWELKDLNVRFEAKCDKNAMKNFVSACLEI